MMSKPLNRTGHEIGTVTIENVDLTMLEQQRKLVQEIMNTLSQSNGYPIAVTPEQAEALSGIENMLDYWSDVRTFAIGRLHTQNRRIRYETH